jgi:hypothetical protein
MTTRIMWAQALDNISADDIDVTGAELTREAAVSRVYRVIERGKRVYAVDGVQLTEHRSQFVLEVMSTAQDQVGRTAPIICCSQYEANLSDRFANLLTTNIEDFAKRIGRGLVDRHAEKITEAIDALKKNIRLRQIMKLGLTLAAGLLLLSLTYRIVFVRSPARSSDSNTRSTAVWMLAACNASAANYD